MTAGVLVVATSVVVALAVTATGYPVNHVSANDGGVWLVNDNAGTGFAEINVPVHEIGAHFGVPGSTFTNQIDVLQEGTTIIAVDEHKGVIYPVNESQGAIDAQHGVTITPASGSSQAQIGGGNVALGGGVVAVMQPGAGGKPAKLWAANVGDGSEASLVGIQTSGKPLATLSGGEAVAVDDLGDVYFASATKLIQLSNGAGGLQAPTSSSLPDLGRVELATVGSTPVVLDPTKDVVYFPASGSEVSIPTSGPVALQQSGPSAAEALVATSTSLLGVPLGGGSAVTLATVAGSGLRPAQPIELDGCAYGAWAGAPGADVRACQDSGGPVTASPLAYKATGGAPGGQQLTEPVLRVNNGFVVLNDAADGGTWLVAGNPSQVLNNDDWLRVFAGDKPSNSNNADSQSAQSQAQKPKLDNPPLNARAGQESVLHLLDRDTDPNSSPLSITSVTPASGPGFSLSISPDTQTVLVTLDAGAKGAVQFSYSVVDGKGETASGPVTVNLTGKETPPAQFKALPTLNVVSGGNVSFSVLPNWRDPESDPVSLVQAAASSGQASWTSDGMVDYSAPSTESDQDVTVSYYVTDGRSATVAATQAIHLVGTSDTTAISATAEPDVARVVVGQMATLSPLHNDLFGADPATPSAKLQLVGAVPSVTGLDVATNVGSGELALTASQAGEYLLSYQDSFGSAAPSAPAAILVSAVAPPTALPPPPVTTPVSVVVHGTNPTTVDVLASDVDPAGGLLTVTGIVTPLPAGIVATVQQGQFIRVSASNPPPSAGTPLTAVVDYRVSDGLQAATGQVSVTEEPALAPTPPIVPNTYATVRAANGADVAVLAAASDPSGEPISLVNGGTSAGAVTLSRATTGTAGYPTGLGTASISGAYLRYAAPSGSGLTAPETIKATFAVAAADGSQTTGTTIVTVLPDATADTQPEPVEADARVVAGGTVTIPIPTTGVDPDGQNVTVTGLTSSPHLGRVLAVNANSIAYQAYPLSSTTGAFTGGTDTFSYQVTSPSGQSAQAVIRVGVTPPAAAQSPVAIDHFATAAPGSKVVVDLLAGDVVAPGDQVTVVPLSQINHPVPGGARLLGNTLEVKAPSGATPISVAYGITDGTSSPSIGHVVVRSQASFAPAPIAADYYPRLPSPSAKSVSVNVMSRDSDPGGSAGDLKVLPSASPHVQVKGKSVVLPIGSSPQAVPYAVQSKKTGEEAVGVIHLPGNGNGLQLRSGTIHVPEGGTKSVDIASYITDPGHTVRITTTNAVQASPSFGLVEQVTGGTAVKLTGTAGYQGPGSLVVQVTDAASLSAQGAHTSTFAIPVIVGNPTAIVRCPDTSVALVQGGRTVSTDLTSFCQVWTPDGKNPGSNSFTETWTRQAAGVGLSSSQSGRVLTLTAASSSKAGSTGQVQIGVPGGGPEASAVLNVVVIAAPLATVNPVNVPGVETGHPVTVDMSQYVTSPLAQPKVSVSRVAETGQGKAQVANSGSTVTITPQTGSHGTETFTVWVTDQGQDRIVSGTITLQVLDVPSAPTGLQGVPANKQVVLSWQASNPNGAPVTQYRISMSGGASQTTSDTTYTWTGLQNGQSYTFAVVAVNQVGPSQPSPSGSFSPKSVPDAPSVVTAKGADKLVDVSWANPFDNGQPILSYMVTITPSVGGPSTQSVGGDQTSMTWSGLDNNVGPYSFTVVARNAVGPGPTSPPSRPAYAHGIPAPPAAPTAVGSVSVDQTSTTITVNWSAVSPCNDAQPCKDYVVTEFQGNASVATVTTAGNCGGSTTQCTQSFGPLTTNGAQYSYEVAAVNEEDPPSPPSAPSNQVRASGHPDPVTGVTATAGNGSVAVTFPLPAVHGGSITQFDYVVAWATGSTSGTAPYGGSGQGSFSVSGLTPMTNYTISIAAENEIHIPGPASGPVPFQPYGSPQAPGVTASNGSNPISYNISGGGNEGLNIVSYTYCFDNPGCAPGQGTTIGAPSAVPYADNCGQNHWIYVFDTDAKGQTSGLASANGTTNGCPPPPTQTVHIAWGGAAPSGNCGGDPSCRYINVTWSNFPAGGCTITFYDSQPDNGVWLNRACSIGSGNWTNNAWFGWGGRGFQIWVTINGVRSSETLSS